MESPIRFKAFTFYYELGELIHRDGSGRETIQRLAPQPSKLLLLLLESYPGVLSQEEIKAEIWPEVQVDYERSLHYCMRQVRAALQDSAAHPKFIETIPRRGYRWIADIDPGPENNSPSGRIPSYVGGLFLFGLLLVLSLFLYSNWKPTDILTARSEPIRVAVMPFQPTEKTHSFFGNDIAFRLVESLTNTDQGNYEVIGPTTTIDYAQDQLRELVREYEIDCIINGKFSLERDTSRLLAEIIRANDGAHVWVKYFDATYQTDQVFEMILNGFIEQKLAEEN